MIINQITLRNFRVFRGEHVIDLAPRRREREYHERPIILFGGLNGAGKTSILTAIRLALYGKLAFNNIVNQQDYIDVLTSLIHNGTNQSQSPGEASVELIFTYNKNGKESIFTVTREWKKGKKDKLSLSQDGKFYNELNDEQCQGFLNELIPNGIADLFFFDGEKISELAEDETGSILRTAVRRLLGLDLISKLRNDLAIYIKRQKSNHLGIEVKKTILELEDKEKKLGFETEKYLSEASEIAAQLEFLAGKMTKLESQLSAQGGAFAQSKSQEQNKVEILLKEKEQIEKAIRNEFDGSFPFALSQKKLAELIQRINIESEIKHAKSFERELTSFLEQLKHEMSFRSKETSKIATEAIADQLDNYMAKKPSGELIFDISEREAAAINYAINVESKKSWGLFNQYRDALKKIEVELEQSSENISRAPDDEQLLDIFNKIRELDANYIIEKNKYKKTLEQAMVCKNKQLEIARKIQKMHDLDRAKYGFTTALKNADTTISLLDTYSKVLTKTRVKNLEKNFSEAYRKLARKEDLQLSARINPDSFDVELIEENGTKINRKLLSAGEKQIYAIAVLESLAKTSGRELPVIIDTPLGRLDSFHRDKLINYYFPYASHQVILLSTDTEVDEKYFVEQLRDDISHAYEIKFDSYTKSSSIKKGYFWELTKEII